jgi:3-phosphoshikimate 1-carboxyvinyltransferase
MADGLNQLGISAQPLSDGICIQGGKLTGGNIDSKGDHRIAMAFAMAGLCASNEIVIKDCVNVNTSFPDFVTLAASVGLKIQKTTSDTN